MKIWQFKYLDETFCEVAVLVYAKTWQSAINKFHRNYGYGYTITEIKECIK